MGYDSVGAVVIGRNEGARLDSCLRSLIGKADPVVYVDSGSSDGSVELAKELGGEVVELGLSEKFTAARARNAGLKRLTELAPDGQFVQFVDGDCEVHSDWIETAMARLSAEPSLAAVCGRRRERYPDATVYNRMIDREWDTPIGDAKSCGGDALMRRAALAEVDGFNPEFIAGEEPDLCFRMRQAGWRIERLDAEMTLHDANLTRLSQWWTRARRGGYAYGLLSAAHGKSDEKLRVVETRRAIIWGLVIPVMAILGAVLVSPWFLLVLMLWPFQILWQVWNGKPLLEAIFLLAAKVPETFGIVEHAVHRWRGQDRGLIEYK